MSLKSGYRAAQTVEKLSIEWITNVKQATGVTATVQVRSVASYPALTWTRAPTEWKSTIMMYTNIRRSPETKHIWRFLSQFLYFTSKSKMSEVGGVGGCGLGRTMTGLRECWCCCRCFGPESGSPVHLPQTNTQPSFFSFESNLIWINPWHIITTGLLKYILIQNQWYTYLSVSLVPNETMQMRVRSVF